MKKKKKDLSIVSCNCLLGNRRNAEIQSTAKLRVVDLLPSTVFELNCLVIPIITSTTTVQGKIRTNEVRPFTAIQNPHMLRHFRSISTFLQWQHLGWFLKISTYSTGTSSTMMSLALNSQRKWAVNYLIKENLSSVELLDLSNKIEKREKIHSHITRPGLLVQAKVIKASNMTVFESKPILIKASLVHLFFFCAHFRNEQNSEGKELIVSNPVSPFFFLYVHFPAGEASWPRG